MDRSNGCYDNVSTNGMRSDSMGTKYNGWENTIPLCLRTSHG